MSSGFVNNYFGIVVFITVDPDFPCFSFVLLFSKNLGGFKMIIHRLTPLVSRRLRLSLPIWFFDPYISVHGSGSVPYRL